MGLTLSHFSMNVLSDHHQRPIYAQQYHLGVCQQAGHGMLSVSGFRPVSFSVYCKMQMVSTRGTIENTHMQF